jgi:hypothetical protein
MNAGVRDGCGDSIARASLTDALRILGGVMLPTYGKGLLIRRPTMKAAAELMGFDTGALTTMQYLRRKYGPAPLLLAIPGRPQLLLFDPRDAAEVLTGAPAISDGYKRKCAPPSIISRRATSSLQIQIGAPRCGLCMRSGLLPRPRSILWYRAFARSSEMIPQRLRADGGDIPWDMLAAAWFRMVRPIVLGDRARDDEDLTNLLNGLRRRANWAFFLPQDRTRRRRLHERLQQYLTNPENSSLVSILAATRAISRAARLRSGCLLSIRQA